MKICYLSNSAIPSTVASSIQIVKMCEAFSELKNNVFCLASHGWNEVSDIDIFDFIDEIKPVHVLVTDIAKDGMMSGPNYDLYSFLKVKFPHLKIIASGGIRDINDVQKLISIKIEHAVIGKAIYEEKIELMELLNVN